MICTEWKPFWSPDFAHLKESLNYPVIFDGRNLYDPERLADQGIQYFGMGRKNNVALVCQHSGRDETVES